MLTVNVCFISANPAFLTYADIPPEVVERILGQVSNPLDMARVSEMCTKFKALAMYVMYGRLSAVIGEFGLGDPREFLRYLRRSGIYWAGPSLLSVIFPNIRIPAYDGRLDLHVDGSHFVQAGLNSVLRNAGYQVTSIQSTPQTIESFALAYLDYPYFGSTVKQIQYFTKNVAGRVKEIVVFVSKSDTTGFLSITEYPTTLFMVSTTEASPWDAPWTTLICALTAEQIQAARFPLSRRSNLFIPPSASGGFGAVAAASPGCLIRPKTPAFEAFTLQTTYTLSNPGAAVDLSSPPSLHCCVFTALRVILFLALLFLYIV
ncbi:hypothetical protein MD484_g1634, partial [Candolleomyces efflorescens]